MTNQGAGLIFIAIGVFIALLPAFLIEANRACFKLLGFSDRLIEITSFGVRGTRVVGVISVIIGIAIYMIDEPL